MLRQKASALAISAALAAAATLGYIGGEYAPLARAQAAVPAAAATTASVHGLPDFTELVETQGPAVVNISITQRTTPVGARDLPFKPGDPMYEFFRRFQMPMPDAQPAPRQGVGSGFIITPDGYILTNAHVVANASEVTVKLTDKREFRAKVVGADLRTDVAVVKIDAASLPTVKIGDPSRLRTGEWVAAIGSPFGLENTVTAGIVSAKQRALPSENYVPFIQTDVAVNPGNSGGPLFNMAGEVVGMNSQIYSRTGGYMGLSFAIPIDAAIKVKDDLVKYGKVSRGRIGVTIQDVDKALADSFGLEKPQGALVAAVEPGSPADKAGLKPGDIIVAVEGKALEHSTDLPRLVGETKPGASLGLQVWRNGGSRDIRVTVGAAPADKVAAAAGEEAKPAKLGLVVRRLTPEERKASGVNGGVVVERADGPAAEAGIQPGDVILAFGNEKIESVEQLHKLVGKSKGSVALLVKRDDATIYVPLKIG
ncbi:MAG TPA: DegQ family serine endoprotease [Burkholderiales bacterium]|nr:DegQ family serine endoprotease [Burkholderiales bacterium]